MNTTVTAIVTRTADTAVTKNRAVWSVAGHVVVISRRRLASGAVRVRISVKRMVVGAQLTASRVEYRDLSTVEADTLFIAQVVKWNNFYEACLAA